MLILMYFLSIPVGAYIVLLSMVGALYTLELIHRYTQKQPPE